MRDWRIMCLGDSITRGVNASSAVQLGNPDDPTGYLGYRKPLDALVLAAGWNVTWVGTEDEGDGSGNYGPHEGHGNHRIDELTALVSLALAATTPDIILLHAGIVDANQILASLAQAKMQTLLQTIAGADFNVLTLVSYLTPAQVGVVSLEHVPAQRDLINLALPDAIVYAKALSIRCELVHVGDLLDYTTDLSDWVHPNDRGYAKMAYGWYRALEPYVDPRRARARHDSRVRVLGTS